MRRSAMIFTLTFLMAAAGYAAEGDGTLDQAASPTGLGPAGKMYSLRGIYARLHSGTAAAKGSGFTEPLTGPADGVMYTLNNILDDFNTDATACNGTLAANILSGKTFFATSGTTRGTNWGPVAGTMTDRTGTDVASTAQAAAGGVNYFTAASGYYDGTARVSATNAQVAALAGDLSAGNVKSGATIFGVAGSYSGGSYGLPKTQQTTSYADYDDGYYKKGTPAAGNHYTDNGDGTITDNATGLMWVTSGYADADTNPATAYTDDGSWRKYTWANALLYCHRLNDTVQFPPNGYLGYHDWRLPNTKELQSIVNFGNFFPAIGELTVGWGGSGPFTDTKIDCYWSSTSAPSLGDSVWYTDFSDGRMSTNAKNIALYVRPVRGG